MRSLRGCEIIEYNIQMEHIHMVMIILPKYKVSEVIRRIKAQIASKLRKSFLGYLRYTGKKTSSGHRVILSLP